MSEGNPFTTVPPSIDGSPAEFILFNGKVGAASATSLAATNLVTPPGAGSYRVSVLADTTVIGTGTGTGASTVAVSAVFQDPLGATTQSVAFGTLSFGVSGDNYNSVLGANGTVSSGSRSTVFRAGAAAPIQIVTTYTKGGALTTGPTVQLYAILETLGQ